MCREGAVRVSVSVPLLTSLTSTALSGSPSGSVSLLIRPVPPPSAGYSAGVAVTVCAGNGRLRDRDRHARGGFVVIAVRCFQCDLIGARASPPTAASSPDPTASPFKSQVQRFITKWTVFGVAGAPS